MFDFKGKKALVTGASGGIGGEIAKTLHEAGAEVAISGTRLENLQALSATLDGNTQIFPCNLSDPLAIEDLLKDTSEKMGDVDILINNAGFLVNKSFEDTTLDDFHNIYSTNVFSVAMLIKRTIKYMHEGSNVINISSIGGVQGSVKFPGLSAYSSSKGALNILTEMLAEEYKEKKVHFNSLALGSVQTKMLEKAFPGFKASTSSENMAKYIYNFATEGYKLMNGKVVSISSTTP